MKSKIENIISKSVLFFLFFFCTILFFSANAGAYNWRLEQIDIAEEYTYTAIAIDPSGSPHIVYGDVRYAYDETGTWSIEPIPYGFNTSGFSLILDANKLPHLSYYYSPLRQLVYAHYNGEDWQFDKQTLEYSFGYMRTSLQLDSLGRPHIVYPHDNRLCYGYFDGVTWQTQKFGTSSHQGQLKLDSNGLPHIAYVYKPILVDSFYLYYWRYDGANWHEERMALGEVAGGWGFDLDSSDEPHFVISTGEFKHIYANETGWQTDVIDAGTDLFYSLKFEIDSQDNMHLAYYDPRNRDLLYAFYDGTLHKDTVDTEGDVGNYLSLAIDNNNLVHLAYADASFGQMKYARMISDYYPDARFTKSASDGEVPFAVNFTDNSSGEITSWFWDFGDGTTSTERNPLHIYEEPGHFDPSLTVTGPGGSSTKKLADIIWAYQLPRDDNYIAYVGEIYGDSYPYDVLTMIDCETNMVIDQVDLPHIIHGLSASKDGKMLLTSLYYSGYAARTSTINPALTTLFNVPGSSGSVISPDDSQFYVCSNTSSPSRVTRINVDNDNFKIIELEDFSGAYTPVITPDSRSLFVANSAYRNNCGVLAHIKNPFSEQPKVEPVDILGCSAKGLAISPNGRYVYASTYSFGNSNIVKIPYRYKYLLERQVKLPIDGLPDEQPWAMAISPDNRWLYITMSKNNLHIVDLNTFELANTIVVGGNPRGIAITPDGKYAYVCTNSKICVIDIAQQTIIEEIPIDRWGFVITIARKLSVCDGDIDTDGDVDGADVYRFIIDPEGIELSNFATLFGVNNCLID